MRRKSTYFLKKTQKYSRIKVGSVMLNLTSGNSTYGVPQSLDPGFQTIVQTDAHPSPRTDTPSMFTPNIVR